MTTAQDVLKIEKWRDGLPDGVGGIVRDPSGEDGIYTKNATIFEWFPVPANPLNISRAIELTRMLHRQYTQPQFSDREEQMKFLIWLADEITESLKSKDRRVGPERDR